MQAASYSLKKQTIWIFVATINALLQGVLTEIFIWLNCSKSTSYPSMIHSVLPTQTMSQSLIRGFRPTTTKDMFSAAMKSKYITHVSIKSRFLGNLPRSARVRIWLCNNVGLNFTANVVVFCSGRREFGLDTLDFQKKYERIKERGEHKCKQPLNPYIYLL